MLDLTKFTTPKESIIPIVNGWGQVKGRKIWLPETEDGWYLFTLSDQPELMRPATPLETLKATKGHKVQRAFALGTEAIPWSFDQFKRIGVQGESLPVHFMNLDTFEIAKIIQWDDGRFYYQEPEVRLGRETIKRVKEAFDNETSIATVKGVTPEMRYYYLILTLQRQSYREYLEMEKLKLSEIERAKRLAEFQATFAGRLKLTVEKAGGTLTKFSKQGNNWVVQWRIGDQDVKSTIHDDLRLVSAGFCLSGDDKKHTMASIVQLARLFKQNHPLNITRY